MVIRVSSSDGGADSTEDSDLPLPMAFPEQAAAVAAGRDPMTQQQQVASSSSSDRQMMPSEEARAVSAMMNQLMSRVFMMRSAMDADAQAAQQAALAQRSAYADAQQRQAGEEAERQWSEYAAAELLSGVIAGLAIVFGTAAVCCCCLGPAFRRRQQTENR